MHGRTAETSLHDGRNQAFASHLYPPLGADLFVPARTARKQIGLFWAFFARATDASLISWHKVGAASSIGDTTRVGFSSVHSQFYDSGRRCTLNLTLQGRRWRPLCQQLHCEAICRLPTLPSSQHLHSAARSINILAAQSRSHFFVARVQCFFGARSENL